MKRIILSILLIISCLLIFAQKTTYYDGTRIFTGSLQISNSGEFVFKGNVLVSATTGDTILTIEKSRELMSSYIASNQIFNGNRAITRITWPYGINVGGSTINEFLEKVYFPSVTPIATIVSSQSTSQEFMSAGTDLTTNLTWSATRPTACLTITGITVNSISQTLDSPFAEGHTQNGVLSSQALPRNTNTTYTITVTSTDKSGSESTTVTWYYKRYWGAFYSSVPPTDLSFTISDANILALTGAGIGIGNELSTTRVKNYNGINGGGNYLVFAFPSSWSTPTFVINGLISTAFTRVRNDAFVNAVGGTTTYQIWVSNTTQAVSISQFDIE